MTLSKYHVLISESMGGLDKINGHDMYNFLVSFFQFSQLYPENRRPNYDGQLQDIMGLSSIRAKDVASFVKVKQNKTILPMDVHNLRRKLNKDCEAGESEKVQTLIDEIEAKGGKVQFATDENNGFKYLAFVTKDMMESLEQYPEILIMDATYKCNACDYALLNILVIDANGQGIPVFHAFVSSETSDMLSSCLTFFAECYLSDKTSTIFVDKDMAELLAIRAVLPHVSIRLCSFHASMAVKRALTQKKIAPSLLNSVLNMFNEQKTCETDDIYFQTKEKMKDLCPPHVLAYFQDHWWSCPRLWATCFSESQTYHITTTNHAESFHQKLKQTLSSKTSLSACIHHLLSSTEFILQCRQASSRLREMSIQYNTKHNCPTVNAIQNDLTSFGSSLVVQQLVLSRKYEYDVEITETECFQVKCTSSEASKTYTVTDNPMKCDCSFFKAFSLPCRHIFAQRSHLMLPLYVCDNLRFKVRPSVHPEHSSAAPISIDQHVVFPAPKCASPEEKFLLVRQVTSKLESFLPLLGEASCRKHIESLSTVFDLISLDKEFVILEIESDAVAPEMGTGGASEGDGVVLESYVGGGCIGEGHGRCRREGRRRSVGEG
ncbi:uncharacterized protein [Littorina saxatilis]|uniref:uncharacterized protein n=1 Tax=Littorina saxatilis TaxID=31220 RepID=UPI0038B5C17B